MSSAAHGLVQGVQRECDPGRPSLRPLAQKPESLLGQACAAALGERASLIGIEGELIGTDLEDVPRQAPARKWQFGVGACDENYLRSRPDFLQQNVESSEAPCLGQLLEVVEDQLQRRQTLELGCQERRG